MIISYNWLKWYIDGRLPDPKELESKIIFHAFEVESLEEKDGDFIFDIKTLPDRNHDCLSHQGMAREIAGLLNLKFKDPTNLYSIPESKPTNLKIEIESEKCRRYMGRIIRNIKVGPSPDWVKKHLESIGQRSINNIVDATNIVMYDSGQPCHAFDLDKIGTEKIIIRNAKSDENIILLTEEEKKLTENDLVISSDRGNALAIAGVKGGKFAEVDSNTKNILIEVANFDPASVRKTAQRLSILTDSLKRFENDLSPELCSFAMRELSALFLDKEMNCEDCVFEEIVDIYPNKQEFRKVSFGLSFVNKKLGTNISLSEIENILNRYEYKYILNDENFEIEIPTMRLDLNLPEDMVDEICRIYGYEKIEPVKPEIKFTPSINEKFYKILWAKNKLMNDGYKEVITYSFKKKGKVEVMKSASDKSFLRVNITDGLRESFDLNKINMSLLGIKEVKIFEIGNVWNPLEEAHVAWADKKGVYEKTLDEFCEGIEIANSYDDLFISEVENNKFSMWSSYPFISRDLSIWVPEGVPLDKISEIIRDNAGDLLIKNPSLVDEYHKDGRVSYSFRLIFQSMDRTLTDEEVNVSMNKVYEKLKSTDSKWELR